MGFVFEHDATPTWSGFIYQGYVAIYLVLSNICELLSHNLLSKEDIGAIYQLEVEKWEDVSILKDDGKGKCYVSIHQIKNRVEKDINAYKQPLIQLMLEKSSLKSQNLGTPKAYLHTSSAIKEDESKINQLLLEWKDRVIEFYNNLNIYTCKTINESDKADFQKELEDEIKSEPIGLNRSAYKDLLKNIKKCIDSNCTINELKEEVKKLCEYLDKKLAVSGIDEKVKLYHYDDHTSSCDVAKLFDRLVEQVKRYKELTKSQEKLIKEQYEYIVDKLLHYIRNHITNRHRLMQKNENYQSHFFFGDVIRILDASISDFETKGNIMALRRHYDESLEQYCRLICKSDCEGKDDHKCRLLNLEYSKTDLNEKEFVKMCFGYNPNCDKELKDRLCLSELLKREGLHGSVFEVLKKVADGYFVREDDRTRIVLNDDQNNAFLTAIAHNNSDVVVENIIGGLDKNTELVSQIFEADELITQYLHSDDGAIWDNNYSEIDEKYINEKTLNSNDDSLHNICKPKKPKFVTADEIIKRLI